MVIAAAARDRPLIEIRIRFTFPANAQAIGMGMTRERHSDADTGRRDLNCPFRLRGNHSHRAIRRQTFSLATSWPLSITTFYDFGQNLQCQARHVVHRSPVFVFVPGIVADHLPDRDIPVFTLQQSVEVTVDPELCPKVGDGADPIRRRRFPVLSRH